VGRARRHHEGHRPWLQNTRRDEGRERSGGRRQGEPLAPLDGCGDDRDGLRMPGGEEGEPRRPAGRRKEREDRCSAFVFNKFEPKRARRGGQGFSRGLRGQLRERLPRERQKFLKIRQIACGIDRESIDSKRLGHPVLPRVVAAADSNRSMLLINRDLKLDDPLSRADDTRSGAPRSPRSVVETFHVWRGGTGTWKESFPSAGSAVRAC